MKKAAALIAFALLWAGPAPADCYADYKAKRDVPLRLHYGVIGLPDDACDPETAPDHISLRLGNGGWSLLGVMSLFDESGLEARRERAGEFFLKY